MKTNRLLPTLLVTVLIILGIGYVAAQRLDLVPGGNGAIVKDDGDGVSDYSAIFLTNGQVYFGKIASITETEVDVREIFYLQVSGQGDLQAGSTKTPAPTASPDISLVKLGNELHGPNDRMRINRDQVLFTESLREDSKVVKAISDYQKK